VLVVWVCGQRQPTAVAARPEWPRARHQEGVGRRGGRRVASLACRL
jgi:hypothetical protein